MKSRARTVSKILPPEEAKEVRQDVQTPAVYTHGFTSVLRDGYPLVWAFGDVEFLNSEDGHRG